MRKRQWKKVLSLMLALAMVFTMNTGVFAAEAGTVSEPEAQTVEAPAEETAPAAETPAAEAPAEETAVPAETEAPVEEEKSEAEAPAEEAKAEEPAAAETPAKEAAEEAVSEKAAGTEEAAGDAITSDTADKGLTFTFEAESSVAGNTDGTTTTYEVTTADGKPVSVKGTRTDDNAKIVLKDANAPLKITADLMNGTGENTGISIGQDSGVEGTIEIESSIGVSVGAISVKTLIVKVPSATGTYVRVAAGSDIYYIFGEDTDPLTLTDVNVDSFKVETGTTSSAEDLDAGVYSVSLNDRTFTTLHNARLVLSANNNNKTHAVDSEAKEYPILALGNGDVNFNANAYVDYSGTLKKVVIPAEVTTTVLGGGRADSKSVRINNGKVGFNLNNNIEEGYEYLLGDENTNTKGKEFDTVVNDGISKYIVIPVTEAGDYVLYYRKKSTGAGVFAGDIKSIAFTATAPVASPWKAYTGDLKVTNGTLYVSENDANVLLVSSNEIATDMEHELYNTGNEAIDIGKIVISANEEAGYANSAKVYVSGNGVSVKETAVGEWLDNGDGFTTDASTPLQVKGGKVALKDGVYSVTTEGAYTAESTIYEGEELTIANKGYSVSYNENWISFNKAGTVVSVDAAPMALKFKANDHISDKDMEFVGKAAKTIFVQYDEDGSIGYIDEAIKDYGSTPAAYNTAAGATVSKDGIKLTSAVAGARYALSGGSIKYPEASYADESWKIAKGKELEFNDLDAETEYYILTLAGGEDKENDANSTFIKISYDENSKFTTKVEAPASDWKETNDWYAKNGESGDHEAVSVNGDGALLIPDSLMNATDLILVASSNSAEKISNIFISGNNVTATMVTLSANGTGVKIEKATVADLDKEAVINNALKAKVGSVIKDSEGNLYYESAEETLYGGDTVYLPTVLKKDIDYTVSYNSVTFALSGNRAGKVVVADGKAVSGDSIVVKDKADAASTAADDFVGKKDIIIESSEKDIAYYYIDELGEYVDTVTTIGEINDYNVDYFTITPKTGLKYAFSTVSYDAADRKDLSFKSYTGPSYKVVSYNNVNKKEDVAKLTPGQKYYVYDMAEADVEHRLFAKYDQEPAEVTLGVSIDFVVKPVAKSYLQGKKISFNDIKLEIEGTVEYQAGDAKKTASADDIAEAYDLDKFEYAVSLNGWNNNAEKKIAKDEEVELTKGKETYTLKKAKDFKADTAKNSEWTAHNAATIDIKDGSFYVYSTSSDLIVTPGTFYYAQGKDALVKNASAVADGKGKVEADDLDVKVGTVSGDKFTEDDKVLKKAASENFTAHFFLKGAEKVSQNKTITIEKRPVTLEAVQNYFSLRGADLAKAEKIDTKNLKVYDLGDIENEAGATPYENYFTGDATPVFTEIDKNAISSNAFDYSLKAALKADIAKVSANYIFENGNAEGFGYYVVPKYDVTFEGDFTSASFNGAAVKSKDVVSVNSAAANDFANLSKAVNTKVEKFDITASIKLPSSVVVKKGSKFIGWTEGSRLLSENGADTITKDITYTAKIREGLPGFSSSENGLAFVFDDKDVYYTGLKHIANVDAMVNEYSSVNGTGNAISTLVKNKNSMTDDLVLEVYVGDKLLLEGYDYKAVYKNNVNAYDATNTSQDKYATKAPQVTITFKNQYASYPTVTKYFTIKQAELDGVYPYPNGESVVTGSVTDALYYNTNTKGTAVKTGLVNSITGAPIVINKNGKKDAVILIDGSAASTTKLTAGTHTVKVQGSNNYTGSSVEAEITVVEPANLKTVKVGSTKAKDKKIDFTAQDTFEQIVSDTESLRAGVASKITANKTLKNAGVTLEDSDEVETAIVKGQNYMVPGAKKINFTVNKEIEGKYYVIKGTYAYTINKANATDITFKYYYNGEEYTNQEVPFVKTGATLDYTTEFGGETVDLSKIVTVKYSANKKVGGTAKATPKAVKGAYISGRFTAQEFKVGAAVLTEDNVTLKYIVADDVKGDDDAKTMKAVKSRKSIVVKDELGNVLTAGKDYSFKVAANGDDAYTVTFSKGTGKNYTVEGEGFAVDAKKLSGFLGQYALKYTGNITAANMKAILEEGKTPNEVFGSSLTVKKGSSTLKVGTDYDIVVTTNASGGKAYLQVIGIDDTGAYGGSDVFGKKQISKKVK